MQTCSLSTDNEHVYTVTNFASPPRIGVVGREHNRIDYTQVFDEVRCQEKELLARYSGLPHAQILFLNQVHGDAIHVIKNLPEKDSFCQSDADAMITNLANLCLVIRTADCVPLFAVDHQRRCVGAAHSGWRSSEKQIAVKMVRAMVEEYHVHPEDISVYMLPAIGSHSYKVNMDVAARFPGHYAALEEEIYLDLYAAIESSLKDAGVLQTKIYAAEYCTLQHNNLFFSHRAGDAGRNLNFICV
jgi:polyphenol oxidase